MKQIRLAVLALVAVTTVSHADSGAITAETFTCIRDYTPVRGFYVHNLDGNVAATVAAAEAESGGTWPEGSLVQLVPGEAMVKREAGFNPATRDWEFFELDVSADGTSIRGRGFADVVNRFGGNCFACHVKARPEFDLICEQDHGCDPIPLSRTALTALQKTDPRCDPVALTEEETAALQALSGAGED